MAAGAARRDLPSLSSATLALFILGAIIFAASAAHEALGKLRGQGKPIGKRVWNLAWRLVLSMVALAAIVAFALCFRLALAWAFGRHN